MADYAGFVIGRAAAIKAPVAFCRLERRAFPEFLPPGRLNVMVRVKEYGRLPWSVQPICVNVGMDAGKIEYGDVFQAALLQEFGHCFCGPPYFFGGKSWEADARNGDELL